MSGRRNLDQPLREIFAISERMNRMLDEGLGYGVGAARPAEDGWDETCRPPVDLVETADAFVFRAELPGVAREDVDIEVDQRQVTVRGHKRHSREVDQTRYHRMECAYGRFERRFQLPVEIDAEAVQASLQDGVLMIRVPRKHRQVTRKVEIRP